jgi:uncharacterized protein YndB with AHSA1/START domain
MISDADRARIATFDHRYALRHVRVYPHPIERVWEAVTTPEHLAAWYVPTWVIEPRLGGRWSCSFGNPDPLTMEGADAGFGRGVITAWEPPRLVDYGGQLRFELETVEGGTQMTFIQTYPPHVRFPVLETTLEGGNPGGAGYPIFPGSQAGNHLALDDLGAWLAGRHDPHDMQQDRWRALTAVYVEHFRANIPTA